MASARQPLLSSLPPAGFTSPPAGRPGAALLFLLMSLVRIGLDLDGPAPAAGGGPSSDALLLETGDYVLLETGDFLLLE